MTAETDACGSVRLSSANWFRTSVSTHSSRCISYFRADEVHHSPSSSSCELSEPYIARMCGSGSSRLQHPSRHHVSLIMQYAPQTTRACLADLKCSAYQDGGMTMFSIGTWVWTRPCNCELRPTLHGIRPRRRSVSPTNPTRVLCCLIWLSRLGRLATLPSASRRWHTCRGYVPVSWGAREYIIVWHSLRFP
jgi:hypothetical protein